MWHADVAGAGAAAPEDGAPAAAEGAAAAAAATDMAGTAAAAGPSAQAASRKRVLTEAQLNNLKGKACGDCGMMIAPASKTCKHCQGKQVLKTDKQMEELLAPLKP